MLVGSGVNTDAVRVALSTPNDVAEFGGGGAFWTAIVADEDGIPGIAVEEGGPREDGTPP